MSRKTILIVEDNDIQREGLGVVLRREGYEVLLSADAAEAVAMLERIVAPDLILLDMMIPPPAADGRTFLAARQKNRALAAVPVVIVTALGEAGEVWARSFGACGLLLKPLDTPVLLDEVRRCLEACRPV